jgi:multicomponent Na+:H+ antiporter subunit G
VIALCAIGAFFSLSGAVGILRMPDVCTRIQCSSKTITIGALPMLVALAVAEGRSAPTAAARSSSPSCSSCSVRRPAMHWARAAYKTDVPLWSGSVADEPRGEAGW